MARAVISAGIVFLVGFVGCFLGEAFCIMLTGASMTGCIVYAMGAAGREE